MIMHAGIPCRLEPRGLLGVPRGGPDLLLRDGASQSLYDFAVVDPRAAVHLAQGSAEQPLQAVMDSTAIKDRDYRAPAEARGYSFEAIPIETFGAFGPQQECSLTLLSSAAVFDAGALPASRRLSTGGGVPYLRPAHDLPVHCMTR